LSFILLRVAVPLTRALCTSRQLSFIALSRQGVLSIFLCV
jgi:hypothetical protein